MTKDARTARGEAIVEQLFGVTNAAERASSDPLGALLIPGLFGDVWSREGLSLQQRSMVTVAALTVLQREDELLLHLRGARRIGIARQALEEIAIQLGFYGGMPVARTAMGLIKKAFEPDDASAGPAA
jgi:4-carboxymuconolactone decarboxylase